MTVTELTDLKTTINWLLENGDFKDTETAYNIAMNSVNMLEKQLSIPLVVNRRELLNTFKKIILGIRVGVIMRKVKNFFIHKP